MKKKVPIPQLTAWLIVAISAPALSLAGKVDWLSVVISTLVCTIIGCLILFAGTPIPRWVRGLELAWAILFLGTIGRESSTCWNRGPDASLLPLVLIVSATFAVRNGAQYGARSGAALLWFVLPGVLIVRLAGIGEMNFEYFTETTKTNTWLLTPLLLLPVLGRYAAGEDKRGLIKPILLSGIFVIATSIWITASMPPHTLTQAENAFYEYSKGITLFGVAERFEAASACLLTAGWFALFAFVLGLVFEILETERRGYGKFGVWCAAGATVLVMYNLHITLSAAGILTLIFWGFLPLLTQVIGVLRKLEK